MLPKKIVRVECIHIMSVLMKSTETEFQIPALNEIVCDGEPVLVRNGAYDAYRVGLRLSLNELCS